MNISKLFKNLDGFLGQAVEVQGVFVLVGTQGYMVGSINERDDKSAALNISIDNLEEIVMRNVPPSAGTKYYYLDEAVIVGTLCRCSVGEFSFELRDVTSLKIVKSGEVFIVI